MAYFLFVLFVVVAAAQAYRALREADGRVAVLCDADARPREGFCLCQGRLFPGMNSLTK